MAHDPTMCQYMSTIDVNGTYEEHSGSDLNLRLWTKDGDEIRSSLLVGEANRTVRLGFDVMDEDALLAE